MTDHIRELARLTRVRALILDSKANVWASPVASKRGPMTDQEVTEAGIEVAKAYDRGDWSEYWAAIDPIIARATDRQWDVIISVLAAIDRNSPGGKPKAIPPRSK